MTPRRGVYSRRKFLLGVSAANFAGLALPGRVRGLAFLPDYFSEEPRSDRTVYVAETGHHVGGDFLHAWARRGGMAVMGPPLTEKLSLADGDYQVFSNGMLFQPTWGNELRGPLGDVRALKLGLEWIAQSPGSLDPAAGDRTSAFGFWQTGFGVHPRFWNAFLRGGGAYAFGYPISNLVVEGGEQVQWFERARMHLRVIQLEERIVIAPLGAQQAQKLGIETTAVPMRADAEAFNGVALPLPKSMDQCRIEVDLTRQRLFAVEGDEVILQTKTSTGRWVTPTPVGEFPIFRRVENERMIGGTAGDFYDLTDVYYTQYFTGRGDALHYAYWHDNFGTPMSHGCVNLTLWDSEWLWNFAALGVPIKLYTAK